MKLFVTDLEGVEHAIDAMPNWTVMEIIRDGDQPMRAECGGSCACATCHVYVDPAYVDKLPKMRADEDDLLDSYPHRKENSRLSCQIQVNAVIEGLRLTVAPED